MVSNFILEIYSLAMGENTTNQIYQLILMNSLIMLVILLIVLIFNLQQQRQRYYTHGQQILYIHLMELKTQQIILIHH